MARIRTIKPDFWTDGNVVKLSPFARLLYIGMWNFTLCDHGHVADDTMKLKLQILPMDPVDIDALLAEIMDAGRVVRVTSPDGRTYLLIKRFGDHQKIDPRWKTRCPACAQQDSLTPIETPVSFSEPQRDSPKLTLGRDGKGKEGMGEEGKASGPHPIPKDFSLTPERKAWATENTPAVNAELQTDNFIDYWGGERKKKTNWETTWRNWMRTKQADAEAKGWKQPALDMNNPANWK